MLVDASGLREVSSLLVEFIRGDDVTVRVDTFFDVSELVDVGFRSLLLDGSFRVAGGLSRDDVEF